MTVADRCLCRCGDPFHLEKGGDLCNVAATYLWLISDEAVIDLRFIADQLQSGFQACANHSAMSAHDSVISQQVRNSSDRLLKWYAKGLNLYCSTSPNQSSVYQHGNNCSILIYSFNCNCPVVNILKTYKEMIRLWKASFLYAFVLIENRSTVSHRPVTAQLQPVTDHSPTSRRPVSTDRKPIAVRIRLTVADRSPINRWQVAKPITD